MANEQEPVPYIYIGSAFPGSERVQQLADIVRTAGIGIRIGEPDMFTRNAVAADRTVRNRLIAGSIGVILDLKTTTFVVTADKKEADGLFIPTVLVDLDPQSHKGEIERFIERNLNDSISTLG